MMNRSILIMCVMLMANTSTAAAADAPREAIPSTKKATEPNIEDQQIPRIVLHDILTDRVCIADSKLYSMGWRVLNMGKLVECTNTNPTTFGGNGDEHWVMRWTPVVEN